MKITILALHLGYGGIEKFISNVANMFAEDNDVEIISVYKLYDKPPFYINSNVKIRYLLDNLKPNRSEVFESIKSFNLLEFVRQAYISFKILYLKKHKMKKAVKELNSDIVISTIPTHNKLVSKYCNKSIKRIATEHNYKDKKYINKVVKSCKSLDYLVIASKKLSETYKEIMSKEKCQIINIPLQIDYLPENISLLNTKNITYIGRLSAEKGVMDLIDVFKQVHILDNEFKLNIVGDGTLRENIIAKIKEYKLEDNINLHGFLKKNELEKILLNTSIGINTSYTESFGLAIIETFSYGIPCIAFSSAEGATEIIDEGKNGFIIYERNIAEMANKIVELVTDKEKLKVFGKEARTKSLKFKSEEIKNKWSMLINNKK